MFVSYSCKSIKKESAISPKQNTQLETSDTSEKLIFPDDWLGYWQGDLNIYGVTGLKQSLPMALDNAVTDIEGEYTWAIIYGQDTIAGRRDYSLKEVDKDNGHYVVDENNGILLDSYLIDNELISVFDVMGNTLTSTYKREDDKMIFEIMMYKSEKNKLTGDTIIGLDTIPAVSTYRPVVRQKAILSKRRK